MEKGMRIDVSGTEDVFDICDRCEHLSRVHISSSGYLCRKCIAEEAVLRKIVG